MVRMSTLRNYPVVLGNKSKGILHSMQIDKTQKTVRAFIVSCGLSGKRIVLPEDVASIADGFILIHQCRKYKHSSESAPHAFVRDTSGLLLGRTTDYAMDKRTLCLHAVEFSLGYLPADRAYRIWSFDYSWSGEDSGEVVVPSCIGSELIHEGGKKRCACPP